MNTYVVITPARDEEAHIGKCIESMARQTVPPLQWILVDDGSVDRTGSLMDDAAQRHPWITAVKRNNRGFRKQGGGVIDAFYAGYASLSAEPWDFLVKLDADMSFGPRYFEECLAKFAEDPHLGIGGGMVCHQVGSQLVCETPRDPIFHVRGATKIYRRHCWHALEGLVAAPGWDGIDELKANMLGWHTRTFKDLPIRHHRLTGTVDGTWRNWEKNGLSDYISGYHPLFMAVKCVRRIVRRPYVLGALGLWWGFCRGYISRKERISDQELVRYIRTQQIRKLLFKPSLW